MAQKEAVDSPEIIEPGDSLTAVREMVATKRRHYGAKYEVFIDRVVGVLNANVGEALGLSGDSLRDLVMMVDIMGEESAGMMKRLKDACTGCGWCCSQTTGIIVSAGDAERISRRLQVDKADYFTYDGEKWIIKQAHPCQWWHPTNGRCRIYNIRPATCRQWPICVNEKGQRSLHPAAECSYAVAVLANKVAEAVMKAVEGARNQAGSETASALKPS